MRGKKPEVPGKRCAHRRGLLAAAAQRSIRRAAICAVEELESRRLLSADVLTYHNDNQRTGQDLSETLLTPSNVNAANFGKQYQLAVDGYVYAQPLYKANVAIPGQGTHNVLFVATEHDSLYAFDADSPSSAPLWKTSFINPAAGVTSVPSADVIAQDINPEVGITATPVIDPATNTIYVEVKTKEVVNGVATFAHRLHALDLTTGAEKFGGPVLITASVPGTGDGSVNGVVTFNPLRQNDRAALTLVNGSIYLEYASHGDNGPYHGWVFAYNATTLKQTGVFNANPNSGLGGLWEDGDGLAVDPLTNSIFGLTGNGEFDGVTEFGDSLLKFSTAGGGLSFTDFFTPYNQQDLDVRDVDFGSSGAVVLPDQPGAHPHLLVTSGKEGTIYLVDRDNLGKYDGVSDHVVQVLPHALVGSFDTSAYWNGHIYYVGSGYGGGDTLKEYTLTNGLLNTTPAVGAYAYGFPGSSPSISANGNTNGILWTLDNGGFGSSSPSVLRAYDANNVANEIYDSTMAGTRDTNGPAVKFTVPTVANGKVYIGGQGTVTAYGLFAPGSVPPTAPASLAAAAAGANQINLNWVPTGTNQTGFKIEQSTDGTHFTQIGTAPANATTYSDGTVTAGTKYYYRIRATNSGGDSPYSNVTTATTGQATQAVFLSDLAFASATNGWGPVEKDKSNGEAAAGDGHTISIRGTTYAKGLGVHPASDIVYNLNKAYTNFSSDVGVDDEAGGRGSVTFQVWTDGAKVYDSGLVAGTSPAQTVNLNISGVNKLELIVTDGGDGFELDHSDWANARVLSVPTSVLPGAPTNLTATASSISSVTLGWVDTTTNETGYKIERSLDGVTFAQVGTTGPSATAYTDNNLFSGTKYYYRVRATNGSGDSVYTSPASATTPLAAPTTPSNGSAVAVSTSQINVSWRDAAYNETGYNVYRKTGTAGTFNLVTTLPPNSSSYTDTGLTPATEYDYHVQAFNAAGYSDFAGSSATTPAVGGAVYVSDLGYVQVSNGWGPVEKDTSNGESNASDGRPITLNGVGYQKGLGVHANGEVDIALNGAYARFRSDVGIDDEVGTAGSVTFQVWADGVKLYDSGLMTGTSATKNIDVDVTGKQTLRLIVTDGGDGFGFDHADWAGARVIPTGAPPPANAFLSDLPFTTVANGWGPVEKNTSNGENAAGDGRTISIRGQTFAKGLGVHANSDLIFNLGGQYTAFTSAVGVDDEVFGAGSVDFQAFADGVKVYDSGVLTGRSAVTFANFSLVGINKLELIVTDGGDGFAYDHADWAGAKLTAASGSSPKAMATPTRTPTASPGSPAAPTNLTVTSPSRGTLLLQWTRNAINELGNIVERSTDGVQWTQISRGGQFAIAYTDSGLPPGTYYYRLKSYNDGGESGYSNVVQAVLA